MQEGRLASYKVPQNIDMEDRIVGPLTMLQFVYLLIGGMIIYVSWMTFDFSLFMVVALPVGFFTLCMAFLKVQDQPFSKFITATLLYLTKPKTRVWQKESVRSHLTIVAKTPSTPREQSGNHAILDSSARENLAQVLDSGGKTEAPIMKNEPEVMIPSENPSPITHRPSPPKGVRNLAAVIDSGTPDEKA